MTLVSIARMAGLHFFVIASSICLDSFSASAIRQAPKYFLHLVLVDGLNGRSRIPPGTSYGAD